MGVRIRRLMVIAAGTALCFASVGCGGCNKMVDDALNTPENRQNMIAKTTASCVAAATKDTPAGKQTPEVQSEINKYCGCVSDRIMSTFPGSDMIKIAIRGMDSLSPEQKAKLETVVKECRTESGF